MIRMVVTDHIFADLEHERAAARTLGAALETFNVATEAETIEALRGANIALVNFAPVTDAVLEVMAPGAVIVRYGIGYDNVDLEAADARGIAVCNVPDYGGDTVADHAVTLALMLMRKIIHFDRVLATGEWISPPVLAPILASSQTTVGLLGTGRIGLAVARRLQPFGFKVLAFDPFANQEHVGEYGIELVSLDELFAQSNLISLHAPATPETHKIINAANLDRMRPGSFIVNTARGALIDQDAVLEALGSGQLAGVGLDVFDPEPLPRDHGLRTHPNAILTPHAAFYSEQSLQNLQRLASEEAIRAGRGENLRCLVNRPALNAPSA
ncbi:C-terminal binding protein [Arthrobacter ginkgonis]|uniref:C-terminal binding protein n=1 Tax=Arthrobacter ginkgonis TaxID=1630594 RepID=A0ABP7CYJ8_9MICC